MIDELLKAIHDSMLVALNGVNPQYDVNTHLRVNIMMPVNNFLKMLYGYNMDNDTDRFLVLGMASGAAGRCWQTHEPVICDLENAKHTYGTQWNMDPSQQALVRPTLKSLLCVPIFDREHFYGSQSKQDDPLLGVLNYDSDEKLLPEFGRAEILKEATISANMLARALKNRL